MNNCKRNLISLLAAILMHTCSYAQQTIAQPYYADGTIRFYNKDAVTAASPCYTLDLSSDINTNWGVTEGINDVVIYNGKLFVSVATSSNTGGVMVYNYSDVYPSKTAGPVEVLKPQTTAGLGAIGLAIQPSTGNLFVGTSYTGSSDAGIYEYTSASGYTNASGTQFMSFLNDQAIAATVANIAFDASGNLWFTSFNGTTAATDDYLTCLKAANINNYYKIINPASQTYAANNISGGTTNVYLLSAPEGLAFDPSGNLWVGNNNDSQAGDNCNPAGDGTLVKISATWITGTLFGMATGSTAGVTVPTADATVDLVSGGKLGGLLFDHDTLYINDQGQNQGSSYTSNGTVWKWTIGTAYNSTNFKASGIHTTYPGNGLMALDNSSFSLASDCAPAAASSAKDIVTFTIPSEVGSTVINTTTHTVTVLMPSGTNLAALTPTITVSASASINPASGVQENFSNPVTYVVTAQDATTQDWVVTVTDQAAAATGTASSRAAAMGKGMNLSVWLENEYWFNSTTTYPDTSRFHESDIANLKSLCFQSVRLPVLFEGFASPTAPYAFTMSNNNVVQGLNYVDSVIKWCATNNMMLIIDNHIADDNGSTDQTDYQITDNNYQTQAALIAAVWKQVIARYEYTNPDMVIFELRNEPNLVSDANLRIVYQTVIDTVRKYDHTHTLVVGNTGYYDPIALSQSTPYSDTDIIYTTHIYDGDGFYGFCEQGSGGVTNTDSVAGTHISFPVSGQVAEINTEMQDVHNWSTTHNVPVWLGEFGCTTLPDVYRDDTSRCNYINAMAAQIAATGMPWACWDGYGPTDYISGFGSPTPLYYGFSIFDRSNILDAAHLDPCFATALQVGGTCTTGIQNVPDDQIKFTLYPNPSSSYITLSAAAESDMTISNTLGQTLMRQHLGTGDNTISIANLASGVYLVTLTANGETGTRRLVVE